MRVLLIEDDSATAQGIELMLKSEGFNIYSTDLGVFTYYLQQLGLPRIGWLTDPRIALGSILIVDIWKHTGFAMLVFLAALQRFQCPRALGGVAHAAHQKIAIHAPLDQIILRPGSYGFNSQRLIVESG